MNSMKNLINEMIITELLSEDKIHKKIENRTDSAGNRSEMSVEKGVTVVTLSDSPGKYKRYGIYGFEHKDDLMYHGTKPGAVITHHLHNLKDGGNGIITPNENEQIKKEGRFEVLIQGKKTFHKTATAAKRVAFDAAKKAHSSNVSQAKAAADWGYTGKHFSQSRAR